MAHEPQPIDICSMPEVARLADAVHRAQRSRILRHGDSTWAVLMTAFATPDEAIEHDAPAATLGDRRRPSRQSVTDRTARALKVYRLPHPLTPQEEIDEFAQGAADKLTESMVQ